MFVNEAAGVLEPHQHLVLGTRERQHRGDLLAQRGDRARADIALEVEHEHPRAIRAAFLLPGLRLALAGLRRRLAFLGAKQPALQGLLHPAIARAQIANLEPLEANASATSRGKSGNEKDHGCNGSDDGERFGQKQSVLQQIVEHRAGSLAG